MKRTIGIVIAALAWIGAVGAQELSVPAQPKSSFLTIVPRYETGFAAVLVHEYQSGSNGTKFNFLTQGGQDTLFPFQRFSLDVVVDSRHIVSLLYQPLTLNSKTVVDRNGTNGGNPIVIDGVSFAVGKPLDLTYGFDFWRGSYLFDFAPEDDTILGLGLSLQIRNAAISFTSSDGNQRSIQQNIGPVPIVKVRAAHWFLPNFGLDFEADGFYASSAFFNGAGRAFTGWIWDASVTAKTKFVPGTSAFLSIRSIGGGAEGTNAYSYVSSTTSTGGSYTWNNLATLAVTLGATIE